MRLVEPKPGDDHPGLNQFLYTLIPTIMSEHIVRNNFLFGNPGGNIVGNPKAAAIYSMLALLGFHNTEFDNSNRIVKVLSFDQTKRLPRPFNGASFCNEIVVSVDTKSDSITWWFEWDHELLDAKKSGLYSTLKDRLKSLQAFEDDTKTGPCPDGEDRFAKRMEERIADLQNNIYEHTEA